MKKYWLKVSINDEAEMDDTPDGHDLGPAYYLASEVDAELQALRISISKIAKYAEKHLQAAYDRAAEPGMIRQCGRARN